MRFTILEEIKSTMPKSLCYDSMHAKVLRAALPPYCFHTYVTVTFPRGLVP